MIDLHVHTDVSDGDYSPLELLRMAKQKDISVLSITDHDTTDAYSGDLFEEAASLEMRLVPGIELSTTDESSGQKIHVLGLFIDPYDRRLKELCADLRQKREKLTKSIADKLAEFDVVLDVDDLIESGDVITKAHIAQSVITNSVNQAVLEKTHGHIPKQGEFIERWLIKGCPAFVPKSEPLLTHQAIQAVHDAGGVASCAHPAFNVMKGFSFEGMQELILRNGFDAVEAVNIQYDRMNGDRQFDMVEQFSKFAKERGLLVSGGSDFHGDDKESWGVHSELGLANEMYKVAMRLVSSLEEASSSEI